MERARENKEMKDRGGHVTEQVVVCSNRGANWLWGHGSSLGVGTPLQSWGLCAGNTSRKQKTVTEGPACGAAGSPGRAGGGRREEMERRWRGDGEDWDTLP